MGRQRRHRIRELQRRRRHRVGRDVEPRVPRARGLVVAVEELGRQISGKLTDLGGKVVAIPQAEVSTSAKGHLADGILCLYMSVRSIGR